MFLRLYLFTLEVLEAKSTYAQQGVYTACQIVLDFLEIHTEHKTYNFRHENWWLSHSTLYYSLKQYHIKYYVILIFVIDLLVCNQ